MPIQNASHTKEKILSILNARGPILPVYIAKEAGISMLFASAFLSELSSDKKIKMSHMRVGNSPIYYVRGQESQLEKFSGYLKSKEKDAFLLIQEKRFLKDSEQSPAIRVALREIKDFAIPFKKNNETFWKYLTASEGEFNLDIKPIEEHKYIQAKPKVFDKREREIGEKIIKDIKIEDIEEIRKDNEKLEKKEEYITLPIIEKKEEEKEIPLPVPEEVKLEEIVKEKKKIPKEKKEKHIVKTKSPATPKRRTHKIKIINSLTK